VHVARVVAAAILVVAVSSAAGCSSEQEDGALCVNDVAWPNARDHEGEHGIYSGEVQSVRVATGESGSPTFLNIGADYPDSDRLTVVVWGEDADKFGDLTYFEGRDVCVEGAVQLYEGVAQIVVDDADAIFDVEASYEDAPSGYGW
jgi:hypothetical protein